MGILGLLGGKTRVQFIVANNTVIQLDVSEKEDHKRDSPPTENPIETGQDVSDHIILKPFSLEITGIISDTPIGDISGLLTEVATSAISRLIPPAGLAAASAAYSRFSAVSNSSKPSVAAYNQLLNLQANGEVFDVLTSLKRYSNMMIASISAPREAAWANALLFTVSLRQILIVSPQSVNIQVFANPGLSANNVDTGSQGLGLDSRFTQGVKDATAAAKKVGYGSLQGA